MHTRATKSGMILYLLTNDMSAIDVSNSNTVSLTSQLESCNRFMINGPSFCISDPDKVSTSKAKFGAMKCSTHNCANLSTSTASCNSERINFKNSSFFYDKIFHILLDLNLGLRSYTAYN